MCRDFCGCRTTRGHSQVVAARRLLHAGPPNGLAERFTGRLGGGAAPFGSPARLTALTAHKPTGA
jgi:hypothetical protein